MHSTTAIRRLALAGFLLALGVVVLGAYVRLSAAGLGCPDWPGCYGHLTPTAAQAAGADAGHATPLHVGKAWREMIHRYFAATLGLIIIVIAVLAVRAKRHVPLALSLVALVMFQGALGAFTVTLQLKPLIVTAHLAFGLLTLSLLFWLWLSLRGRDATSWQRRRGSHGGGSSHTAALATAGLLAGIALPVLAAQILLGGWTSSNYAAVACPDFPKCQAAWVPEADYGNAFVLWRGLGINYEGGVLQHPARVAIHFTHRLGAVVATLALLAAAIAAWLARLRGPALTLAAALALQLLIGISMVVKGFPLAVATAHNAGAALLLLATLLLLRHLNPPRSR